jgi:predicted O-methyltransferase YrrM
VVPAFTGAAILSQDLIDEMEGHPEAAGKSSWGTRNVLQAFILSMRPKTVLEIGAHIGSASIVMGAALKANRYGTLYCLEPQAHYFAHLNAFVQKAGLSEIVKPLQLFSTSPELKEVIGEKIDMIYLDGDHSYSAATFDLELCDRLLSDNGLIFLDDVGSEVSPKLDPEGRGGVRQALLDFSRNRPDLHVILLEHPFWLNPCGMGIVCKQIIDR